MAAPFSNTARALRSSLRAASPFVSAQTPRTLTVLPGRVPGLAVPACPARLYTAEAVEAIKSKPKAKTLPPKSNSISVRIPNKDWKGESVLQLRDSVQREFSKLDKSPIVKGVSISNVPGVINIHLAEPIVASTYYFSNMAAVKSAITQALNDESASVRVYPTEARIVLTDVEIDQTLKDKVKDVESLANTLAEDLAAHNTLWQGQNYNLAKNVRVLTRFDETSKPAKVVLSIGVPDSALQAKAIREGVWVFGKRLQARRFQQYRKKPATQ